MISFTTVCMDRLDHLKKTLPRNIEDTKGIDREFIILNYNSKDRMNEWLWDHFQKEIKTGLVKVFHTLEPKHFNMSHSKNAVAKQAKGDILIHIDADNFIVKGFSEWVLKAFRKDPNIIIRTDSKKAPGGGGKIVIKRKEFEKLQGYNETFKGWGYEDLEFIARAQPALTLVHFPLKYVDVIQHSNRERFKNYEEGLLDGAVDEEEGWKAVKFNGITETAFYQKYDGTKYFEQSDYDYESRFGDPEAEEYFNYVRYQLMNFWELNYVDEDIYEKYHTSPKNKGQGYNPVNYRWGECKVKRLWIKN